MFLRYPAQPIKTGKRGKPRGMCLGSTWPIGRVVVTVERYEREKVWDNREGEKFGVFEDFRKMNEAEAVRKTARRIFETEPSLRRQGEDDDMLLARIAKDVRNMLVAAKKHDDRVPGLGRQLELVPVVRAALCGSADFDQNAVSRRVLRKPKSL